ncbi:hypothetical protein JGU66_02975 [Myxococcaceae bacterium JPH2]|nr:hypothetical protein [Myxococcaceae bacterium JPH2]
MIRRMKRSALLVGCAVWAVGLSAWAQGPRPDAGTSQVTKKEATVTDASGGHCTGKATFCGVYSQTFCNTQPGCIYYFSSKMCSGIPPKCETATNEKYCKLIKGCAWK